MAGGEVRLVGLVKRWGRQPDGGDRLRPRRRRPLPWRQGTAVAAHLPADALRVLPDASAGAGA